MPNQRFEALFLNWWRRFSRRQLMVATSTATVLIFTLFFISNPNKTTLEYSIDSEVLESNWVPLTLLSNAQQKGAFCLDGSVPGYHIQRGSGSGYDNWLLHGGGWCNTVKSCSSRKRSPLGSSIHMEQQVQFFGILSNDPSQNPDFFSWTKVKIRYCDGASFSGHKGSEFKNETKLFFRGQIIWDAIMDELSSLGLSRGKQALLTGCSAGALATLLHCDYFREIFPKDANVKCLSDGGLFLNVYCSSRTLVNSSLSRKDIKGRDSIELFYQDVVHLQGVADSLDKDCLSKVKPHKCFFPQEFVKNIKTPLFLVNPAYDWWQIQNVLIPDSSDPERSWLRCKQNIYNCNPNQLEILHGFFVNSCFTHCQTWKAETWHSPTSPRVDNKRLLVIGTSTAKLQSTLIALSLAILRASIRISPPTYSPAIPFLLVYMNVDYVNFSVEKIFKILEASRELSIPLIVIFVLGLLF
ncbi:hypothetical protein Leryth_018164 [Lithospermum erythrorhizon]|nr:hypothetical protein Leryth_018164 [Lithospermum erythrorhizon]